MTYQDYFKNKKITVMGLGLLGRGLGDTKFLAECGADLIVTDLKSAEELAPSLEQLKQYNNITYRLGEHDTADFENRDMILKAAGIPLNDHYIDYAEGNNIPIEMDESLFVKLAPEITVIGVTGTRGKTTTASLIYHMLHEAGKPVYLAGNIRGMATLPLLRKVEAGDIVVMELSSWQLQGFGLSQISPNIAVFTNFLDDHLNYYNNDRDLYFTDKSFIFKNQKPGDTLVVSEQIANYLIKNGLDNVIKSTIVIAASKNTPSNWQIPLAGEHNRENIACAMLAARTAGLSDEEIKSALATFTPIEGRLQFLREVRGIKIYNDNNATTPDATIAALKSFPGQKITLIAGGADKKLDVTRLITAIKEHTTQVILTPGSGTDKIKDQINYIAAANVSEAVQKALEISHTGDIILFSPAFSSFSQFNNEYEKNDAFVVAVQSL